ncbi:DNA primase small subunit PriS [Halodesulfurarchaeum sp. HSR-GB]|uniref:DNA primase small subunit PriS n=1 Tax=Halodesulfurarchaeum sp. HSR-GB TaxID=3074077 RepID=UPI00285AB11D|nr:DNA primase small subunit PriS [Halodesulfurarchaeum sp. HSR-GB]MDR5655617.1 DNA primase small subunit PriS [Halodesulfurarchaeum sp. HSR-GB]
MEERTRSYLRGRFRDFYRREPPADPPDVTAREWGYIPWESGPGTTMVRHRSVHDLGSLDSFLVRERPRHVYFSAGHYADPSARTMDEKGWQGSDLVFDLDADHLPSVDPGTDTYAEMLEACKGALMRLLDLLETDFGFEDLTITFSGGRGYHVHVRDQSVRNLDREQRREVVEYVRGSGLSLESLLTEEPVSGRGRKTPANRRSIPTAGGWGRRVVEHIQELTDQLLALEEPDAIDRLTEFDGIGEKNATAVLSVLQENTAAVEAGNVDVHPAFLPVARAMVEETVRAESSPIDEPVTTDTHRLIRLPGSLHGGTGLKVVPIERAAVPDFDPLSDAVPEPFRGHEITVEVTEATTVTFDGESLSVSPGNETVPEYAGIFLMTRGQAEKPTE